MAQDVTSYSE